MSPERDPVVRVPIKLALLALVLSACTSPPGPYVPEARVGDERAALEHYHLSRAGLALEGYDAAAYVDAGRAERGSPEHEARHAGVVYRFASAQNRARFLAEPGRYEPAYGGWCAYAMADGEKVDVDPESFLVQDGRLLLFYDGPFADTRVRWQREGPDELRARADVAWVAMTGE